jgi:pimeloyl-ACP methyl ester carboxylesterase
MTPSAASSKQTGQPLASSTVGVLALPGAGVVYEVTGTGPAVVLVHGFGLDMRMWDPQAEQLAAGFRVVADAGHMINMEQPAVVNELLAGFLGGLAPHSSRRRQSA